MTSALPLLVVLVAASLFGAVRVVALRRAQPAPVRRRSSPRGPRR
jgi:hypothetical protein